MSTTGMIIKQLREERGITQEKLAEMMGYSHKSSINKIEMGKADLTQSKIILLAKIFNVSPSVLLGIDYASDEQISIWDQTMNVKKLSEEAALLEAVSKMYGKKAVELLKLFNELNEQGKTKAIDTITDFTQIPKYQKEGQE